jgi:hypothetical protein
MAQRANLIIAVVLGVSLLGCPTRDPHASNASCPDDAPCFLLVMAPRGQTAAPGPYNIVAEVTGPHRIEGVGLVLSVNGLASESLSLARLTNSGALWGVPDLEGAQIDPPEALLTAQALARLQPGDEVTFLLWAWDQMGNQTQWSGSAREDAGSAGFQVVDGRQGSQLPDAGSGGDGGDGGGSGDASSGLMIDAAVSQPVDAG